jgi:uncharacterized protein with HEPN domain
MDNRDRLTHAYFDMNLDIIWDIIWDIVANDLPRLVPELKALCRHGSS